MKGEVVEVNCDQPSKFPSAFVRGEDAQIYQVHQETSRIGAIRHLKVGQQVEFDIPPQPMLALRLRHSS